MSFEIDYESLRKLCVPYFAKPTICGHYSINKNREYLADMSNFRYYFPRENQKRIKLDLNQGIQNVRRKPKDLDEKLDNLLRFILNHFNKLHTLSGSKLRMNTDFICYRGLLTTIMCTPFISDEWAILACRWNGIVYLCEVKLKKADYCETGKLKVFCSWGFKFEQYMLTDKLNTIPDTSVPVDENEEFCCVFQSSLNSHKLLYGAEMDGAEVDTELTEDVPWEKVKFIEIKTSRKIETNQQDRNCRKFKYVKWWSQSYLVGIDKIVLGIRDDRGMVDNVSTVNVRKLPHYGKGLWDQSMCMNFCENFLDFVQQTIPQTVSDPNRIWKFSHGESTGVVVATETDDQAFKFMPHWYKETYEHLLKSE